MDKKPNEPTAKNGVTRNFSTKTRVAGILIASLTVIILIILGLYVFGHKSGFSPFSRISGPAVSLVAPKAPATAQQPPANSATMSDAAAPSEPQPAEKTATTDNSRFVGKWSRLDGPYMLEIQSIGDDGRIDAVYQNPGPVHIADAKIEKRDDRLYAVITLEDKGYPGSSYSLYHNRKHDVLYGIYFHAGMNQQFNVIFKRMP